MKVIYWFNRYRILVLVGFFWITGFLNIGFCEKLKPIFFWITGFTGSTADPDRISKHWINVKRLDIRGIITYFSLSSFSRAFLLTHCL